MKSETDWKRLEVERSATSMDHPEAEIKHIVSGVVRRGLQPLPPKSSIEATKTAALTLALKGLLARRDQRRLCEVFGKLDWDPTYDYKAER